MMVGLISLGKVAEVGSSKRIFADEYVLEGVPFFRSKEIGELSRGEKIKSELFISRKRYLEIKEKFGIPEKGNLLLTSVGSIGNTWIVDDREFYFKDGNITRISPSEKLEIKYLKYFFKSTFFWSALSSNSAGTAYSALTISKIKKLKIPLPPLAEQKKIAAILDEADQLRRLNQSLIEKYDALSQSLFLDMFGDPVTNPKGWEKVRFEDLVASDCPLTYGIVQPGDEYPEGVPCVRPVDLTKQYVSVDSLKKIDPKISDKFKRTLLKGGEILLSVRGSVGVISIAGKSLSGSNVTRGIVPIWFDENVSNKLYFFYLYKTIRIQNQIKRLAKGATLIQLNLKDLRSLELIKPSLKLQNQFAERLKEIETQKAQAQASLEKSETLFNSLLQRAFKGELVR